MEKFDLGSSKGITLSGFQGGDVRDPVIKECNIHVHH
jgi:hypothetical protein